MLHLALLCTVNAPVMYLFVVGNLAMINLPTYNVGVTLHLIKGSTKQVEGGEIAQLVRAWGR